MGRHFGTGDYERAERMLPHHRRHLVTGQVDRPRWLTRSESFWYRTTRPAGVEYMVADPVTRTLSPAFDTDRLAAGLGQVSNTPVDASTLALATLEFDGHGLAVGLGASRWSCSLDDYTCTPLDAGRVAGRGETLSPDGRWAVHVADHNLWARDVDGAEFPLTHDGTADNAYAVEPTFGQSRTLMRTVGAFAAPVVLWSPDGSRLLTHRLDERDVEAVHLIESTPRAGRRPVTHTHRLPMVGDTAQPMAHMVIIDVDRRTVVPVDIEPLCMPYYSLLTIGRVWWSADAGTAFVLDGSRDGRRLRLIEVEPTGAARVVVEESGPTRVEPTQVLADAPMVRTLQNGEVLWYSQRDGWGHLYRYSAAGELRAQVTSGDWAVRAILHVDEEKGVVTFLASGLVDTDPYLRQICRVDLDGSGFARLTDDADDHLARQSPSGEYVIDTASRVDKPPVTVVRDRSGAVVLELEQADVSALEEAGWSAPERFIATAADGATDVYGILWRPHGFDPTARYPVIDHIYPGPQSQHAPPGFENTSQGEPEAYAALGFAVVLIDGRGTPGRSKAFHDLSYGRLDDAGGIADHVAAITQLAARHDWLDIERVGITGHSGGGFAATRAMLAYPNFYRVGVAVSGSHDVSRLLSAWGEMYHGPWDPEHYRAVANAEFAANLTGDLLLVHGELDDNAIVYQTMSLVDALIEANKNFDMLIVPGVGHSMWHRDFYVTRRKWDYFVRNLMKTEPPEGYRLDPTPVMAPRGVQL